MTSAAVLASTLGQVFKPLYEALAWMIAFFYALIPNYAIAIALLTVAVMVITAPLTVKSTRSTLAMQRLAPELKKLQQKYKGDRATLNEEMMKLYKEHNINPAGGCLPLLIQMPVFIVLYGVIRGLTNTVKVTSQNLHPCPNYRGAALHIGQTIGCPNYIGHNTRLYHDLSLASGHMKAFGLDLAANLFSHHASWVGAIPYAAIVLVAIGLQYLQMRQLNSRNPAAAQANPQMQMMQRYMPLIFAVIYLRISAGVNIYFVVSSLCRIGIQEAIFRSGIVSAPKPGEEVLPAGRAGGRPRKRSLMERLAEAQQRAMEQQRARQAQAGLVPGDVRPKPPADGPKRPSSPPTGTKRPPSAREAAPAPGGDANGAGEKSRAGEPNGNGSAGRAPQPQKKPRPNRPTASGNGGPPKKALPQAQSRSAKKRPRRAR
ncbi:MAG TPA: membrane protein insertase YidC [Acidimicrobiales bacterium]|nr:membrane protein insertase YidC [Acidimicrobiales bacterium]